MRFLSVIASVLIVIVSFNLMNTPANELIVIPDEQVVVPTPPIVVLPVVPDRYDINIEIPVVPTYIALVGCDNYNGCRKPLRKVVRKVGKAVGKVAKVPGRVVKGAGKVARVPFRAVRGVVRARPIRRVLGWVFGRRR